MTIVCNIWMICLESNWLFSDLSWMLQLSEWTLRSSVWVVFNNFLLIDATDRSKICNTPFKMTHYWSILWVQGYSCELACLSLNIIITSILHDQNSHQWQCSIIVMCLCLYHMTSILHCHRWELWSHDTSVYIILSIISIKNEK